MVIWIVLPTIFDTTNISMPSCNRQNVRYIVAFLGSVPAIFDACTEVGVFRTDPFRLRGYATCAEGLDR